MRYIKRDHDYRSRDVGAVVVVTSHGMENECYASSDKRLSSKSVPTISFHISRKAMKNGLSSRSL